MIDFGLPASKNQVGDHEDTTNLLASHYITCRCRKHTTTAAVVPTIHRSALCCCDQIPCFNTPSHQLLPRLRLSCVHSTFLRFIAKTPVHCSWSHLLHCIPHIAPTSLDPNLAISTQHSRVPQIPPLTIGDLTNNDSSGSTSTSAPL